MPLTVSLAAERQGRQERWAQQEEQASKLVEQTVATEPGKSPRFGSMTLEH